MKNHHHNGPLHPVSPNARSVIHETISARAHELWIEYGQPEGRADAIWLQAEQELISGHRASAAGPVLPVSF
jgi:hypothetical protein